MMNKLLISLFLLFFANIGFAEIPLLINYQGRLVLDGTPVTGNKTMIFRIWDSGASGSGNMLWQELRDGFMGHPLVSVNNGIFNVKLGEVTSIPSTVFNTANTYLEVTIGTQVLPRERLVAVPYAYHSKEADHATSADSIAGASGNISVSPLKLLPQDNNYEGGEIDLINAPNSSSIPIVIDRFIDKLRINSPGDVDVYAGNFNVHGFKNAVVETKNFSNRALASREGAEVKFIDEGEFQLQNGIAKIYIEEIFKETIETNGYLVQITPIDEPIALAVSERTSDYFIVKGPNGSNIKFMWQLSAYRKGTKNIRLPKM